MELRVLSYYLTVVREENISRAAEILHIMQPTLSRQMAQLEEELGTQLSMTSVLAWKKYNPVFSAAGKFLEYFKTIQSVHINI